MYNNNNCRIHVRHSCNAYDEPNDIKPFFINHESWINLEVHNQLTIEMQALTYHNL